MRTVHFLIAVTCLASLTLDCQQLSAQGFLDQIGRRLGDQIGREVQRAQQRQPPPVREPSGSPGQPAAGGYSIPGESGRENIGGGNFSGGGFFGPGPAYTPPRVNQPTPRPGVQPIYPERTIPRQTVPTRSLQTSPSAPPRRATNVSNLEIKIRCPKSLEWSIGYQLVSPSGVYPFTIRPGQMQTLVESNVWMIRYTNDTGEVSYRLRGGKLYEFAIDDRGQIQLYDLGDAISEPPRRSS